MFRARLPYRFRSDDNGTIQELVAAGFGAALVPLLTVDPGHEGTAVLGLAGGALLSAKVDPAGQFPDDHEVDVPHHLGLER